MDYFAINPTPQDLHAKINNYFKRLKDIGHAYKMQLSNYYFYNKNMGLTQRSGLEGELTNISVNDYASIARHVCTLITAQRPSLDCNAVNSDYKSQSQTVVAGQILDYYFKEKKIERFVKQAVKNAVLYSEGFISLDWRTDLGKIWAVDAEGKPVAEGDIEYSVLNPMQVVRDVDSKNNDWVITINKVNKYDLAAKYPEHADEIQNLSYIYDNDREVDAYNSKTSINTESETIQLYTFLHKKSNILPEGKYIQFVGDIKLLDIPLPYDNIELYKISPADYEGTCLGYSHLWDLISLQQTQDRLLSSVVSNNITFGTQCVQTKKGSDINVLDIADGMKLIESEEPIQPVQLTKSAPETYNLIAQLKSSMQELSGINEVVRGTPSPNLRSGNALVLISVQALTYNSDLQASYHSLIEDIGSSTLRFLKTFATSPRFFSVVGKYKKSYMSSFTRQDIEFIDRVSVSSGSNLSKTPAGKLELAQNLLQSGLITRPEQYLAVLETGNIDPLIENELNEILLIKSENEQLQQGIVPPVIDFDDHKQHIKNHKGVVGLESRSVPSVVAAALQHIQAHIDSLKTTDPDLLALTGSDPLQPKPMPPQTQTQNNLPDLPQGASDIDQEAYENLISQQNQ